MGLAQTLCQSPACAGHAAARWRRAFVSFLLSWGAAQGALATPLTLIFDEVWHEPTLSTPAPPAEPTPPAAPASSIAAPPWPVNVSANPGVIRATLGGTDLGQGVSDHILRTQVSSSMSTLLEFLRWGNR